EFESGVFVLLDDGPVETYSREQTARARIGQYFSAQFPVGRTLCVPANRPGGNRSIRAQFELAGEQRVHAAIIHDDHDQVNGLAANLKTDASAGRRQGGGSAPA